MEFNCLQYTRIHRICQGVLQNFRQFHHFAQFQQFTSNQNPQIRKRFCISMLLIRICLDNAANESDFVRRSCMFRFSSLFSVFCAGCFCTLTVQQVPAWSEAALPRTQAIAPDVSTSVRDTMPLSAPPVSTAAAVPVCTTESAAVPPPTATPLTTAPPLATSGTSLETTTETTATTTSTCTTVITTETTAASTEAPQTPPETDSFFQEYDTAFKAYMDYRTITDTSSEQYAIQQNAWTDSRGLRRSCDDYLVAMGTG